MGYGIKASNTTTPTRKNTVLAYTRALAELFWGFLEQKDDCSGNSSLYGNMCDWWRAPGNRTVPTQKQVVEPPVFDGDLSGGIMAHNLMVIMARANESVHNEMEAKLKSLHLSLTDETRFACASFYCKCSPIQWQYMQSLTSPRFHELCRSGRHQMANG